MDELKLLTINLWSDDTYINQRLDSLSKIIEIEDVDIVAFQESVVIEGLSSGKILSNLTGYSYLIEDANALTHGCGLLSREPFESKFSTPLEGTDRCSVSGLFRLGSKNILVTSTHLSWGLNQEPLRFKQVQTIDKKINEFLNSKSSDKIIDIALLAGDFNAEDKNDSIRFLKGELGTFQTESAWTDLYPSISSDKGITSSLSNNNAKITANKIGLNTNLNMPERRIDYIFSRGYAYGKPGSCRRIKVIRGKDYSLIEPSDHFGILASIAV